MKRNIGPVVRYNDIAIEALIRLIRHEKAHEDGKEENVEKLEEAFDELLTASQSVMDLLVAPW